MKEKRVLCYVCKKPIHIDDWAGVCKKGMFHKQLSCLLEVVKEIEISSNRAKEK